MAGIITGEYTGIARGVKVMPIKVLDKYGFGRSENLVKGILWAVDNGANVINISIGRNKNVMNESVPVSNTFSDIEYRAIEYALMNNVTVVLPCGNFRMNELSYPAAYRFKQTLPSPIIVSGFDNDQKYFWSNTSDRIDVSAPAENILSLIPKELDSNIEDYINIDNDGYSFCGGTSFSCAYISAMAAIIKALDYELTNEQIRQIIISSAKNIGEEGKDDVFGYGKLDMRKSLLMQRLAAGPNKTELYEGDQVTFVTRLTDMEDKTVDSVEKYLDFDDGMLIIEEEDIENLDDIIAQREIEKEEEAIFENDLHVNIYRYYAYQDEFILDDSLLYLIDNPEIDIEISFETSSIYKIEFLSPTDLWVPFNYYLKVSPQNPTASLEEGLYIGGRQLDFLVDTSETDIYYTTDGSPIIYNNEINPLAEKYKESLNIKKSQILSTVSVKNGVMSDVVTFEYRVVRSHI
ncbi:MAG TPA: S8 family serine peptidase, partial [Bacillota bacterium]|nr:S8 family serine peptidase [Bacillota bacterium]